MYDFCDEAVREYLFDAVDRAYQLGMRYMKNDHNFSTAIGFGDRGDRNSRNGRRL